MESRLTRVMSPFLVVIGLLAVSGRAQELGEISQLLGLAYGNQLNNMMSACCVIRDLECPVRLYPMSAAQQNASENVEALVRRFEQCVCLVSPQCVLALPPKYMPDGAHDITFDITFVTSSTSTRYTCTYRSKLVLICHLHNTMATGMLGWGLPGLSGGGLGPLAALGGMGEEMEEMLEQMMESGVPPPQHPSRNTICPRCVPLHCALALARHLIRARLGPYAGDRPRQPTSQQQYHNCLRVNNIGPPQLDPPPPVTVAPPATSTVDSDSDNDQTTARTTERATTTAFIPTTTPTTTTTTTAVLYTTRTTEAPVAVITTPSVQLTSPTDAATLDVTSSTTEGVAVTATQGLSWVSATTEKKRITTSQPEEITRILVGNVHRTTSLLPQRTGAVTEDDSAPPRAGGGVMMGVLVGVLATLTLATALFILLFYRRRRRQHEGRLGLDDAVASQTTGHKHTEKGSLKHKTASLPSVSSKRAVIDSEEKAGDDDDKDIDSTDDDSDDVSVQYTERYTAAPTAKVTPSVTTSVGDNDVYASLDDTAIISSRQAPVTAVTGSDTIKSTPSKSEGNKKNSVLSDVTFAGGKTRQDSQKYYNTRPVFTVDGSTGNRGVTPTRSSANKYYNMGQHSAAASQGGGYITMSAAGSNRNPTEVSPARTSDNQYEAPTPRGGPVHIYTALKPSKLSTGKVSVGDAPRGPLPLPALPPDGAIYSQPYALPSSVSGKGSYGPAPEMAHAAGSDIATRRTTSRRNGQDSDSAARSRNAPESSRRSNNTNTTVENTSKQSSNAKNATDSASRRNNHPSNATTGTNAAAVVNSRIPEVGRAQRNSDRTAAASSATRPSSSNSRGREEAARTKAAVDAQGYLVPLPPRGQQPRV